MDFAHPLPAREPLLPDESLASLIRRTSDAMGYETPGRIRALLKDSVEVPAHWNHVPTGPVMQRLEILLRQSQSSTVGATVHSYASRLMLVASSAAPAMLCDSTTILKYFQSARPPVCPTCLAEDAQPYERLAWSMRAVPVCLQHSRYLTSACPKCQRRLRPDRCDATMCRCGFDFRNVPPRVVPTPTAQLLGRIDQWFRGDALPLDTLPTCAFLWWFERLTSAVKKLPDWIARTADALSLDSSAPEDLAAWLTAADILDGWPQQLFVFLDDFQRVTKHRTTATGLTRSFGLLLREAKLLEDLGYSLPADALRQYLTDHYTAGHVTSKVCLFSTAKHAELLESRPWISLTEADEILHFRQGGSAALLERGILTGAVRSARPGHRTVGLVSRESVDKVAHDLKTALSVSEVGKSLGLGRSRVLQLIKADLLPRAIRTTGGWRIPRVSVDQLLGLVHASPDSGKQSKIWLDVRQATRQFGPSGLNFVRMLRLIQAGQVRVRRSESGANFRGLLISASDLKNAREAIHRMRDEEEGFPLNRLAQHLFPDRPIKDIVLRKWIALGLLRASRDGRAWAVSTDEVNRFRREYCLLSEAAQLLDIHNKTLLRWIADGILTPVYGPRSTAGGGFHLLRRSDVAQLREIVARHHRKWRTHQPAA